ncbi:hypothetical protein B0H13DRAFT_2309243 [Mycena leptocephala]|nr:hypothetical protein B0H13DRAFT_2309243 [Mycena leptocephala]
MRSSRSRRVSTSTRIGAQGNGNLPAAVQSQILALSYQDNSTRVKTATNAFGFAGVLLDVITACLALLASTILQRHVAILENQLAVVDDASQAQLADVWTFLGSAGHRNLSPDIVRRFLMKIRAHLAVLAKTPPPDDVHGGDDIRFTLPMESSQLNVAAIAPSLKNIWSATSIGDAAGTGCCSVSSVSSHRSCPTCVLVVALPTANYFLGLAGIHELLFCGQK